MQNNKPNSVLNQDRFSKWSLMTCLIWPICHLYFPAHCKIAPLGMTATLHQVGSILQRLTMMRFISIESMNWPCRRSYSDSIVSVKAITFEVLPIMRCLRASATRRCSCCSLLSAYFSKFYWLRCFASSSSLSLVWIILKVSCEMPC